MALQNETLLETSIFKYSSWLFRMRHTFLDGKTPPDFPVNNYEMDFKGRANLVDLTNEGLEKQK